eukprot:CAMPEP_0172391918 /NCGR_PEP_ID=MMETSP1061-20121228/8205_1 /TAXON_ID=37318 /ORGANISM="Pseudo-nitzschia pungens, Strain cf. pungens" /LENGTH=1472 /DNA_ID=CAMNT_0013122659 /DNA_START=216 /DNA_END=4634 /DNA_ORIENTATION=+
MAIRGFSLLVHLVVLLLLGCASLFASCSASESNDSNSHSDTHRKSVERIFDWIRNAPDGFVTPKQGVSRMVEGNIETPLIVVALDNIAKGELLVQTPWSHILKSDDEDRDDELGWYCGTASRLAEEMKLGEDSFYAPYVTYLNEEPDNQLTHQYTMQGKAMLHQIIGLHHDEVNRSPASDRSDAFAQRLMPEGIDTSLKSNWFGTCGADRSDTIATKAASMVVQRADDHILIPAYDAYNHRNNDPVHHKNYMNARTVTTEEMYHQTFALRDIQKGEQIFISYNMCEQCQGRIWGRFGTAEMYREYGFVEWFPQRWWYPGFGDYDEEENAFEIAQFDLYQNESNLDLTLKWTHLSSDAKKLERFALFLEGEIRRLNRLKNVEWWDRFGGHEHWTDAQWKKSGMTSYELGNIYQFADANIVAMVLALQDLRVNTEVAVDEEEEDDDYEDDPLDRRPLLTVSQATLQELLSDPSLHYDALETPEPDDLGYHKQTCDNSGEFQFRGWVDTETNIVTDANFANVDPNGNAGTIGNSLVNFCESFAFLEDVEKVDVCADVNDVLTSCSSFRPHQYEYVAHAAARYLQQVKKVAIIGGSDGMLLHEIMKYNDTLEHVTILEPDQTLARKSAKHFATDLYLDDDRVDWWFGDVALSLRALDESYYGSFDLVLVHLPDRVLSGKMVIGSSPHSSVLELELSEALALLVSPTTGILAKTESYASSERLEKVFAHSAKLSIDQMPFLCSQTVFLGSNGVDLIRAPVYDHGMVDMGNLLYAPALSTPSGRHDRVHDYRSNVKNCDEDDDEEDDEDEDDDEDAYYQIVRPGVLELVTLEELGESCLGSSSDAFLRPVVPEGFRVVEHKVIDGAGKDIDDDDEHNDAENPPMLTTLTVFEEGSVTARLLRAPDDDDNVALALDVHLWSDTDRIEKVTEVWKSVCGAWSVVSHKMVVAGMFGTDAATSVTVSNKATSKPALATAARKARSMQRSSCVPDSKFDTATDTDSNINGSEEISAALAIAVGESVELTGTKQAIAIVFCGTESSGCVALNTLGQHESVAEVIPLYGCGDSDSDNESTEDLYACERGFVQTLRARFGRNKKRGNKPTKGRTKKANMVVIDANAPPAAYRIANSLLSGRDERESFFSLHSIAVAFSGSSPSNTGAWGQEFLDRYRKHVHHDPVKLGRFEISYGDDNSNTLELGIVSTQNSNANYEFEALETRLEQKLNDDTKTTEKASVRLRTIHGGLYQYQHHYQPQRFSQKDYKNSGRSKSRSRSRSQTPLARQTVFRYWIDPLVKEHNFFDGDRLGLSIKYLEKLLYGTLSAGTGLGLIDPNTDENSPSYTKHTIPVGDGCVLAVTGTNFQVVATWNGRERLDVNLFARGAFLLHAPQLPKDWNDTIRKHSALAAVAIDTQPRGVGGVIYFPEDLVIMDRAELFGRQLEKHHVNVMAQKRGAVDDDEEEEDDDDDEEEEEETYDGASQGEL